MKKLLLAYLLPVCLISCNHNGRQEERQNRIPKESLAVIQAVIRDDSMALSSNNPDARPILAQVEPLELINNRIPGASKLPASRSSTYSIGLAQLLYIKYQGRHFFTQQDSLSLIRQGQSKQKGILDSALFAPQDLLTAYEKAHGLNQPDFGDYHGFSLPFFSLDSTRAYIQVGHFCVGCGSGMAKILGKRKNEWQVLDSEVRWRE